MKDNCKSCRRNRLWHDHVSSSHYKEIRSLQFRTKYLASLVIDLQQEILALSNTEMKNKPSKCDECGENKLLYNMTWDNENEHDWLCRTCCRNQESDKLKYIADRIWKQSDLDYHIELLL